MESLINQLSNLELDDKLWFQVLQSDIYQICVMYEYLLYNGLNEFCFMLETNVEIDMYVDDIMLMNMRNYIIDESFEKIMFNALQEYNNALPIQPSILEFLRIDYFTFIGFDMEN